MIKRRMLNVARVLIVVSILTLSYTQLEAQFDSPAAPDLMTMLVPMTAENGAQVVPVGRFTPDSIKASSQMSFTAFNGLGHSIDDRLFLFSTQELIRLWNIETRQEVLTVDTRSIRVNHMALDPNGERVAFGAYKTDADGNVTGFETQIWDTVTGQRKFTWDQLGLWLSISPAGHFVALTDCNDFTAEKGCQDTNIHIRDLSTGQETAVLKVGYAVILRIDYRPGNQLVVFKCDNSSADQGCVDPSGVLWDIATDRQVAELPKTVVLSEPLAFSPDGKLLAVGHGAGKLDLIDIDSENTLSTSTGRGGKFIDLTFNPTGDIVAGVVQDFNGDNSYSAQDNAVLLWDAKTGKLLATADPKDEFQDINAGLTNGIAFSSDGKHLYASSEFDAHLSIYGVVDPAICTLKSGGAVNKRSGAGTNNSVVGKLVAGQTNYVKGQTKAADGFVWWQLYDDSWVRSDLVQTNGDCVSVSEIAPDT